MRSIANSCAVHNRVLDIGTGISPLLSREIRAVDPVSFPYLDEKGVRHFLSRAEVG